MTEKLLLLLFVNVWIGISAQHSPYSLQAAVDALHRREAQLALKDSFSPHHYNFAQEDDYWDDDADTPANRINRLKLNRLLARYLSREDENDRSPAANGYENDFEEENYLPEEKKRSFFREREEKYDSPYQTPFRERELGSLSQPELAEQFLREVEQERELEWEEKYKETLRKLWEKYQQQENEIEQQLFNEEKRKHPMAGNIGPYYAGPPMERKRSYPVLPWLPASRKKRFPVAKRSPKMPSDEPTGADEKVAKDLQAIFGTESDDKKKRSTNEEPPTKEKPTDAPHDKKSSDTHSSGEHNHSHHHHGHDDDNEHAEDESEEHDQDHDHEHEHEHDQDDDDDDQDFDDDDEDRKKKRDVSAKKRSNQEIIREDQIIPGDLTDSRRKKSIQWSKYFGIDRRKKSDPWFMGTNNNDPPKKQIYNGPEIEEKPVKRDLDSDKLENMDDKLKTIEDLIIDETIKYTGAHEGISDPDEIRRLKDHVVSRLATAYSLEKMRRALEKLRQSVDNENHLQRNEIDTSDSSKEKEKEKRVAIKKEKVQFDSNQHTLDAPQAEKSQEVQANNLDDSNEDKKKKKKRNGIQKFPSVPNDVGDFEEELGAGHFEPLNEGYGVSGISRTYNPNLSQCPLLDSMADRCRGVDILSGDIHQELLPVCGIHQLCYLCGTSQVSCDFQYLSEADSICGRNSECQSAARSALMILRGAPGPQLGPKECLKNPCLYRAMREIGL